MKVNIFKSITGTNALWVFLVVVSPLQIMLALEPGKTYVFKMSCNVSGAAHSEQPHIQLIFQGNTYVLMASVLTPCCSCY